MLNLTGINIDKLDIQVSPSVKKKTPYSTLLILLIIAKLWTSDLVAYYSMGQLPAAITTDNSHTLITQFQGFSIILPLILITA